MHIKGQILQTPIGSKWALRLRWILIRNLKIRLILRQIVKNHSYPYFANYYTLCCRRVKSPCVSQIAINMEHQIINPRASGGTEVRARVDNNDTESERSQSLRGYHCGTPKPGRLSGFFQWGQDSWALEYSGMVLSVACLIAIFILLSRLDNQPSAAWQSYFSIQTTLSIIATALKGATLLATTSAFGQLKWAWYCQSQQLSQLQTFDNASRGPFGAFQLLWSLPKSILPWIGSFIVILSIGSDAAIQASTSQLSRSRFSPYASVPVSLSYDETVIPPFDPSALSALYTGAFSSQVGEGRLYNYTNNYMETTSYTISPSCSTENCTFELYASLGIQHQCSNITNKLSYSLVNATYMNVVLPVPPAQPLGIVQELAMPFSDLGGKDGANATLSDLSSVYTVMMLSPATNLTDWGAPEPGTTVDILPLLEVFLITNNDDLGVTPLETTQAFHCNLNFDMQTFTASVDNGVFTETRHDSFPGKWTMEIEMRNKQVDGHGPYRPEQTELWTLRQNISNTEYTTQLDHNLWQVVYQEMAPRFTNFPGVWASEGSSDIINALSQSIYTPVGIDYAFSSIANSLTIYFRTATGQTAPGITESQEQYIRVKWEWLLVPFALVISNIGFLLGVHLKSRQLRLPSWRNSILAFLYNEGGMGIGEHDGLLLLGPPASMNHTSKLEAWAVAKSAKLRKGEEEEAGKARATFDNDSLEDPHAYPA